MDVLKLLEERTETPAAQWESIDGPETGTGVEYWYRNETAGLTAYICIDQGELAGFDLIDEADSDISPNGDNGEAAPDSASPNPAT